MRGGRGGGMGAPRFGRGGGRGFMGPSNSGGPGGGAGPSNHHGRGHHPGPMGSGPEQRQRPPARFRSWQDEMQGINEPEVFAETRLPDGRCYYYNTRTRETMWERPEGPGVRIIRHEEVGRGKGSPHGGPPVGNGQSFPSPGPMGFPGHMSDDHARGGDFMSHNREDGAPGTSPNQPFHHTPPQGAPPRSMLLSHPGMQGDHRFTMQGSNQSMMSPGPRLDGFHPGPTMGSPMAGSMPPPGFLHNQGPPPTANFGMPPPGQYSSPNFAAIPPPWGFTPGMVPPAAVPPPGVDPILAHMDPALVALAAEWTEHLSPDGKQYYFSTKTQASVWEKPKPLLDLEAAKVLAQQRVLANQQQETTNSAIGSTAQTEQDSPDKMKTKRVEKKVEKCRPISSTPVSGTPWCVVWTGDRRVFFYNPANKTSVWERPQELLGRADVEEMTRVCPAPKIKKAEATSTTLSPLMDAHDKEKKVKVEVTPVSHAPVVHEDTHPPGEDTSPEPPQKRIRTSSEDVNVTPGEEDDSGKTSPEVKELIESKDALREMTAVEAEAKAARDRATIPIQIRLKQFREMLIETNVSAFSTWEKELHKIVFDKRYLLLTSNERKKAFDRYVEEIIQEEKLLKQNRFKETKDKFFEFLAEVKVSSKMNYSDFSQKYVRDERFRVVEKSRDRESFFMEYLKLVQKKEKEERAVQKDQDRKDFLELLDEKVKDYHSTLSDVRKKLESDLRYQTLEPEERAEIYRSFQHRLRQEQRSKTKQKKREQAAVREHEKAEKQVARELGAESTGRVKHATDAIEDISEEEEGCITDDSEDEEQYDRERQERAEHSIREREKQVQRSLATHLRDRDKEREFHRHEEAVQEFQALLTDVIRNAEMTWRDTKKLVKKDRRWDFVSVLPREEMEDLFTVHVDLMGRKKKQRFKELLEENRVTPRTRWRDLYPKIKNDPRCGKFNASERKCMREFEEYVRDIQAHMKVEFRELLKETKMLNYRTFESLKHNLNLKREIESHLENDRRYLELDNVPEERERLLLDYLEDLESKGPPPPPTASEPTRRK